ncbi:GDSL-type esterase/lipase family protein [Domibacillus sp. A3M-37]|uniref:GDSL-type esterase/lipase family protein n=1 Tax=Domibacillus sp. A3M-37 TaxID=2962037 RepID=UPI0020B6D828|nr:GDSL-type esterase/lipase family protein [Domibacillus sp. A3M-37]MCP3762162.1 GDSL-type esterase/lipase family protein [Domibacillus sp. A3M-37]
MSKIRKAGIVFIVMLLGLTLLNGQSDFVKAENKGGPRPFTDVTSAYQDAVSFVFEEGIANGVSSTHFGVSAPLKRADAAIMIGKYIDVETDYPNPGTAPFTDMPDRAVSVISSLHQAKIVQGKTKTAFGSYDTVKRGEAAIILARILPVVTEQKETVFTDVSDRYKEAVNTLTAHGIVQGKTNSRYGTNDLLTRGELALMIYRIHLLEEKPAPEVIAFGDSNTEADYLKGEFPDYPEHRWADLVGALNKGESGQTTAGAIKRFKQDVLDLKPETVVIMFGINDALIRVDGKIQVSKEEFEKNITSMVTQSKRANIDVILMTNPPVIENLYYKSQLERDPNIEGHYTDKGGLRNWVNSYNDIIRNIAKEQNVPLVDNYANAILKAGGSTDTLISQSSLVDPLLGIHWTPKGHSMVAYSVEHYLAK